jgi:hypothetical protein
MWQCMAVMFVPILFPSMNRAHVFPTACSLIRLYFFLPYHCHIVAEGIICMHGLFCSPVLFIAVEIIFRREETADLTFVALGWRWLGDRELERYDSTVVTFLIFLVRIRLKGGVGVGGRGYEMTMRVFQVLNQLSDIWRSLAMHVVGSDATPRNFLSCLFFFLLHTLIDISYLKLHPVCDEGVSHGNRETVWLTL